MKKQISIINKLRKISRKKVKITMSLYYAEKRTKAKEQIDLMLSLDLLTKFFN